jgi:hypothetical protein
MAHLDQELSNLHMVLNLSAQDSIRGNRTEVVHVRMEPELKEAIESLVNRHGSTMSQFLRKCCEVTVKEMIEG